MKIELNEHQLATLREALILSESFSIIQSEEETKQFNRRQNHCEYWSKMIKDIGELIEYVDYCSR
mgnify:FL=1|jgi:hypothetical protein